MPPRRGAVAEIGAEAKAGAAASVERPALVEPGPRLVGAAHQLATKKVAAEYDRKLLRTAGAGARLAGLAMGARNKHASPRRMWAGGAAACGAHWSTYKGT